MQSRPVSFGFEIEGEFEDGVVDRMAELGSFGSDGSVHRCSYDGEEHNRFGGVIHHDRMDTAEFRSGVYTLSETGQRMIESMGLAGIHKGALPDAKGVFTEMQKMYKLGKFHWNESAGFHVHVGFSPIEPPEILSIEFAKFFTNAVKKKFPKEYELRKNNHFCKTSISLADITGRHDRYRAVNFASLGRHHTVEFRIWPANEPAKMQQYLAFTLATIRDYLKKDIGMKFKVDLDLPEGDFILERNIQAKLDLRPQEVSLDPTNIRGAMSAERW